MIEDSFFWFRENRLSIPGVRGEHRILHVTDTHLSVADERSTAEEKAHVAEQEALWAKYKPFFANKNGEPYGAAQEISTRDAFDKQLSLAEELQPEVLLLSGDNLDHMHPAGERYLARRLGEYRGKYLCIPGNHESAECPGAWDAGVRVLELEGFRIVALDDSRRTVSEADFEALRALCAEGVPILLLCHVPIITDACREAFRGENEYFFIDGETADETARAFVKLCETSGAIRALICGHVHGYHAVELAPGKPQYIGSQGMAGAVHLLTVTG